MVSVYKMKTMSRQDLMALAKVNLEYRYDEVWLDLFKRYFPKKTITKNTTPYLAFCEEFTKALESISTNGFNLSLHSDAVKKDKEMVLSAVSDIGWALGDADDLLKKDHDVVLAAMCQYGGALDYADPIFKNDIEFKKASKITDDVARAKECGRIYREKQGISGEDYAACYAHIIPSHFSAYQFMPEDIRGNFALAEQVISHNGLFIRFASEELRGDFQLALIAVYQYPKALQYLSNELQENELLRSLASENKLSVRKEKFQSIKQELRKKSCFSADDARKKGYFDGRFYKRNQPGALLDDKLNTKPLGVPS